MFTLLFRCLSCNVKKYKKDFVVCYEYIIETFKAMVKILNGMGLMRDYKQCKIYVVHAVFPIKDFFV